MKIIISGQVEPIETKEFTVIAYAEAPDEPWSGLNGDTAVTFKENPDGVIQVEAQTKPAGFGTRIMRMARYVVRPWKP